MPTTFPDPSPQWAPLSHRGLASFLGAPTISESPRKNANSDPSGAQRGNRSGAGDDPTTLTCPPIEEAICLPRIDQCQDVRVLELRREADLSKEPLGAQHCGELRAQHLERDGAIVFEVAREVHRGHPTAAELALDRVTAGEGCAQAAGQI